jgi:uncharacterized protein (DUF1330 family)
VLRGRGHRLVVGRQHRCAIRGVHHLDAPPVGGRFQGRLLAADEHPPVEEGTWARQRVVVLSFPDHDAVREWADSDAYREIAVDRIASSHGVVLLVNGIS